MTESRDRNWEFPANQGLASRYRKTWKNLRRYVLRNTIKRLAAELAVCDLGTKPTMSEIQVTVHNTCVGLNPAKPRSKDLEKKLGLYL